MITSWDTLIYAFIFCSSENVTCYIGFCDVSLVSFHNIADCWFWTDTSCIVYLCFLIHDYIQSQLVNLRVLFWWARVSNDSLCLFGERNLTSMLYVSGHVSVSSLCTLLSLEIKMLPFVFLSWNRINRLPFLCTSWLVTSFLMWHYYHYISIDSGYHVKSCNLWSLASHTVNGYSIFYSVQSFFFNDDLLQSIQE